MPDWLAGLADDADFSDADAGSSDEAWPDWFADEADEKEAPSAAPATSVSSVAPSDEELPDWLSGIMMDSEMPEPEAPASEPEPELEEDFAPSELPDWLGGPSNLAEEEAAPDDWMSDVAAEEADVEPTAPDELPDWLSGASGFPEETTPAEEKTLEAEEPEAELDWFDGWGEETEEATPSAAPAPIEEEPEAEPDWFAGWEEETDEVEEELPATPSPAFEEDFGAEPLGRAPEASSSYPDWLIADAVDVDGAPPSQPLPNWLRRHAVDAPPPGPPQELPSWLAQHATGDVPPGARFAPAEGATEEKVAEAEPDWFAGWEEEAESAPSAPQPEPAPEFKGRYEEDEVDEEEGEVSDWLRGIEEEPVSAAEELEPADAGEMPDWLRGIEDEAEEDEDIVAPIAPAAEADAGEMPDWLRGIEDEAEEDEDIAAPIAPAAEADTGAMPDWLRGIEDEAEEEAAADDLVFTPGPEPEPEEPAMPKGDMELTLDDIDTSDVEGEVPGWLQSLKPGAKASVEEAPEDESLVRAAVPDWVQDLRPPGTGPLSRTESADQAEGEEVPEDEFVEVGIPESADGLARADIPDWVKQLRPRVSTVAEKERSKTPSRPAEGEGPLAGLPDILPAAAIVDMPEDFEARPRPKFPEEIIEQAQLWQELLEQPHSVERAVARKREMAKASTPMLRVIIAALLVLSALVAILGLSPVDMTSATLSPGGAPQGVVALNETIAALAPGDSVILAVEYGAAEAGEMTLIAETLLDHLETQNVDILAVSTLPDGAGIVHSLLASKSITNQLTTGNAVYLPGTSYGVARFLQMERSSDPALLLVLSARSERLRWWIEQNAVADQIQMGAGVSASVGPWAMPYLQDKESIAGWLVGYPDIVAYRAVRGLPNKIYQSLLGALMFTHWIAFAVLILGATFNLITGRKRIG